MRNTRYQICSINNGELRHLYWLKGTERFILSNGKATMLTKKRAEQLLYAFRKYRPDVDVFIQSEYDCHFRDIDEYGNIIPLYSIEDDVREISEYYGYEQDPMEKMMQKNGVSWSDFI